jgi:exodeoxyribonuclease V gamma subunit
MALTILSSNRVETLQARLSQQLARAPLANPFAREVIVVPTFAMSRWLNLRIAQQQGIAANIHYPLAGEWIWELAGQVLEDTASQDPYSREALNWQLFEILPTLLEHTAFTTLHTYLEDDQNGIKRWQLAQRIAESFDRYQSYRPHTIRDWSNGADHQWQAQLWRAIVESRGQPDRVSTMAALIDALDGDRVPQVMPERVSLFALSSMAPLYLDVLSALARHTELNFYLHSPTDQYWADLENEKRKSQQRLAQPELDELFESGNELLASWGRQGQIFQDLLLNHASTATIDIDLFAQPEDKSLLGSMQRSIFALSPGPGKPDPDDSVSIHVCHSAMRECQVLLDRVLAMLEQDPALDPEDILVMIPDIAGYAPYIEAVFQRERVAYNISDISLADEHPLILTFLQLLNLPGSRFTVTDVLAYLDNEALCRCFGLDDQALQEIQRMIERGHTRWGIDAAQKAQLDLPDTPGNTWQQLQQRFFAGYALATDALWKGIAPLPALDDSTTEALGRFWHFFDSLCQWRIRLDGSRSAGDWQVLLLLLLDDFFVETDASDSHLQHIRNAISEVGAAADCEISTELMLHLLENKLKTSERSGQLYSGGVTFCGMRPMRSIPFKIICLLGMNRGDFPRRESVSDFEIMSSQQLAGDPSKRDEDRYLMLETLLCARQKLYLSYTGRSLRDNSPQPPSVLLQELLDFIDSRFGADAGGSKITARLTRGYPMQAFAAANFESPTASYSRYWCTVANQLASGDSRQSGPWPQHPLATLTSSTSIELEQLKRFINHPVQYFFRARLGVYLDRDDLPDDDETFDLGYLEQWQIKQQLARDTLNGNDHGSERMLAEGLLAHGQAAATQINNIRQGQTDWFEALQAFRNCEERSLRVELPVDANDSLLGSVHGYFPGKGLMAYHGGKFKGRHLLMLWIDHLALSACGLWGPQEVSQLLTSDQHWRIPVLDCATALNQLGDYCALYRDGQQLPLPVLPETSYAWVSEPDPDKAMARAHRLWQNQWSQVGGDSNDPYIDQVLRSGHDLPVGSTGFEQHAQRLYGMLLEQATRS